MEARYKASEDARAAACSTVVRLRPFASLPNEILIHIFARAHPHDIVSILCTCKRFHSASVLFIKQILARSLTQHQLNKALLELFATKGNIPDEAVHAISHLCNAGANVNHKDGDGWTPLHHAATKGDENCLAILIKANADVNSATTYIGKTPLYIAARYDHEECVATLIKANADVNVTTTDNGTTPLYIAACMGREKCVTKLIEANALM